jgi:hypothetical protein
MYRPEDMDEGRAAGKPAHPPNGDHMDRRRSSAYAAEAIGTFLLVLFIVLILAVNAKAGGRSSVRSRPRSPTRRS